MARKRTPPRRSGFLNIDKPPGWTSHDVVARVRRIVGERQVGHAGTLDPAASGVLPVAVGHATKMLPFIEDAGKTYVATIRFGITTDSADRDGRLLEQRDVSDLSREEVASHLLAFRGEITQIPPMHSAIKVDGQALYQLARKGVEVDVPARQVHVYSIDLVQWESPDATFLIETSKGAYIRSIARDLGELAGTGAMLSNLVRTRAGMFHLRSSISIHDLDGMMDIHGWSWLALHPDHVLLDSEVIVLNAEEERQWFNGVAVARDGVSGPVRVYDSRREWIGIGSTSNDDGRVHPKRVVRGSSEQV